MIPFLPAILALMTGCLLFALWQRARARSAAHVPAGYRVLAVDLGHTEAMGSRGGVLLRDNEWGIAGKVDLLLEGPDGIVPVEYKQAWEGYGPGKTRPSHMMQLAGGMLLCKGDSRVGRAPAEGWLRYIDERGHVVPGGEVRVPNSPELQAQVVELIRRMRRSLVGGGEIHRTHHSVAKCRRCGKRQVCGEEYA